MTEVEVLCTALRAPQNLQPSVDHLIQLMSACALAGHCPKPSPQSLINSQSHNSLGSRGYIANGYNKTGALV